jgi:NADH-ubiquinone oxidoreductase chain 3
MTSITFFFLFIPLLAIILLGVNLIFAPHNPYQEKDSTFECGFHSFLGQNRTQFSISFFIFALLFLLFDLEILLVYPYVVSSYTNGIYGLVIMLIFFLALSLGFAFELGKNALKIDSRQLSIIFFKEEYLISIGSSLYNKKKKMIIFKSHPLFKLIQETYLYLIVLGPFYLAPYIKYVSLFMPFLSLMFFLLGYCDISPCYCADNNSDIEYFNDQLIAAQEAENLWHRSKTETLSQEEKETLRSFMSTMDEPKNKFGYTDADFKREHANAKAGLIKSELEAKNGSSFEGKKVETVATGSKHTLDSSDVSTSQVAKKKG